MSGTLGRWTAPLSRVGDPSAISIPSIWRRSERGRDQPSYSRADRDDQDDAAGSDYQSDDQQERVVQDDAERDDHGTQGGQRVEAREWRGKGSADGERDHDHSQEAHEPPLLIEAGKAGPGEPLEPSDRSRDERDGLRG